MKKKLLNDMHELQSNCGAGVSPILVALTVLGNHDLSESARLDVVDAYLDEVAE